MHEARGVGEDPGVLLKQHEGLLDPRRTDAAEDHRETGQAAGDFVPRERSVEFEDRAGTDGSGSRHEDRKPERFASLPESHGAGVGGVEALIRGTDGDADEAHFDGTIDFAEDVVRERIDARDAHQESAALRRDLRDPFIGNAGVLTIGPVREDQGAVDAVEAVLKLLRFRGFLDPAIGPGSAENLRGLSTKSVHRRPDPRLCVNHHGAWHSKSRNEPAHVCEVEPVDPDSTRPPVPRSNPKQGPAEYRSGKPSSRPCIGDIARMPILAT